MENLTKLKESDIVDLLLVDTALFEISGLSKLIKNNLGIPYPNLWIYSKMQPTKKSPEMDIVAGPLIDKIVQFNNIINIEIKIIKPKITSDKDIEIDLLDLEQKLDEAKNQAKNRIEFGFNKIAIVFFVIAEPIESNYSPQFYNSGIISSAMNKVRDILEDENRIDFNDLLGYYIIGWTQVPDRNPLQSGSLPSPLVIKEAIEIQSNEEFASNKNNIIEKVTQESKKYDMKNISQPLILNITDSLYLRLKELKSHNYEYTTINPLLDAFDSEFCLQLDYYLTRYDNLYVFYIKQRNEILNLLKNYTVGHDENLKRAFEIYSELYNIYLLSKKRIKIEPVATKNSEKTPDFQVTTQSEEKFYIELKTLGFSAGNLNYFKTVEDGLNSKISIEDQIKSGKRVAIGTPICISPLRKDENYKPHSMKYSIETIIDKINNNIKEAQFYNEFTFLLIDLKLIPFPNWEENALPFYQEQQYASIVSGILWNIAFGSISDNIFIPIEFEGKENIEGRLSKNGILIDHRYIKALCFNIYGLGNKIENNFVGFYRINDDDDNKTVSILNSFCDFYNDEVNSNGYKILKKE